jgi:hypothetical protein
MRECIESDNPKRRSLGFRMLSAALDGPPWMGSGMNEFGARSRDYGYRPNYDQLVALRCAFIDVAVKLGTTDQTAVAGQARQTLANEFRGMWHQDALRDHLVDAARALHTHQPWGEGWKAVRYTIYFDYKKRKTEDGSEPAPNSLAALEADLEPHDLLPMIKTFVLSSSRNQWALDEEFDHDDPEKHRNAQLRLEAKTQKLDEDFATADQEIAILGPELFSSKWMPFRSAFGRGLAKGANDRVVVWRALVEQLEKYPDTSFNYSVFDGFIAELASCDPALAQELLDQSSKHHLLRKVLVGLHPFVGFTETDLSRCISVLNEPEVSAWMYGGILWGDNFAALPYSRIVDLVECLMTKPNGCSVILDGLSMKLHDKDGAVDTLGGELRRLGLVAATQQFLSDYSDPGGSKDHDTVRVVAAALQFNGNENEKLAWLDAIFAVIDEKHGYLHDFKELFRRPLSRCQRRS